MLIAVHDLSLLLILLFSHFVLYTLPLLHLAKS
jgi:hypothetical protein